MGKAVQRRLRRIGAQVAAAPAAGTWAGIVLCALGMGAVALAWGGAASSTTVALQIPHIVAGGLIGMALVVIGLAVTAIAAQRRDAALRSDQIRELTAV